MQRESREREQRGKKEKEGKEGEKKGGKTNAIKIRFSFYFSVYSQFLSPSPSSL